MIKKGDKVICIKDAYYLDIEDPTCGLELFYKLGEIYEVNNVFKRNSYVDIKRNDNNSSTGFYLDDPIEEWYKFSDYFMTLAEWRNKQIDSILEDD